MIVFPAIDVLNECAVRLINGDYSRYKIYGNPIETAEKWESLGAEYIHIVDLNGARGERTKNINIIKHIARSSKCKIQVGGGIRSMSDIEHYFDNNVERIVLGSACIENPEFVRDAVNKFGSERIICGIDFRCGKVATNGWLKQSSKTAESVCKEMRRLGVTTAICTDIARDGILSGVNIEQIVSLAQLVGLKIIASGGVCSLNDIELLKQNGIDGVIVGKALYENRFSLNEALYVAKE